MIKIKKNKAIIMIGILLLVSVGIAFAYINSGEIVDTEKVRIGTLEQIVSDNGVIEAEGTLTLTAKISMEITKLYAKEGEYVKAGDILLLNNNTTSTLDVSSLKAQAAGVAAQASNAKTIAVNSKALLDAGAISQSEYNAAQTIAAQLTSQLASLNYSIESFKQGAGVGGLISPISGYITELFAKEGETVAPGLNIVEISPLENFYVVLNLIPEDALKVALGNPVTIKQNKVTLSHLCKVERISKKAKDVVSDIGIGQKRIEVIISVPENVEGLIVGNNVDVEIVTASLKDKQMVSSESIFEKNGLKYVYAVENGVAKLREIKIGLEGDKYTEIKKGLRTGDVVILSPSNKIVDGVKIKKQEEPR